MKSPLRVVSTILAVAALLAASASARPPAKKTPSASPAAGAARQVKPYTIDQFLANTAYGGASFSPDGKRLLVGSNQTGVFNAFAIPVDGGKPVQLTDSKVNAIQAIGGIIGEVNEVATAIAAAVQEQGAATQEITRSTQYAAQGTKNVSDNITGVKADADTAAGAADNVKQASETLETQSQQLGRQVSDFLGKIRAA